ncbi:MAG: methyltransferase family protein [Myxococcota bacterium]
MNLSSAALDAWYFRMRGWIPIPIHATALLFMTTTPPRSWENLLSAVGLAVGFWLRAIARVHMGRSSDTRRLHAEHLVCEGPYAHIRNPIYVGNIAIASGIWILMGLGWRVPILAALLLVHYERVIRAEERMLLRRHGDLYRDYRRRVPRLLPHLDPRRIWRGLSPLRRELRIAALAGLSAALILATRYL